MLKTLQANPRYKTQMGNVMKAVQTTGGTIHMRVSIDFFLEVTVTGPIKSQRRSQLDVATELLGKECERACQPVHALAALQYCAHAPKRCMETEYVVLETEYVVLGVPEYVVLHL